MKEAFFPAGQALASKLTVIYQDTQLLVATPSSEELKVMALRAQVATAELRLLINTYASLERDHDVMKAVCELVQVCELVAADLREASMRVLAATALSVLHAFTPNNVSN